ELANFDREQELQAAEGAAFQDVLSIAQGNGKAGTPGDLSDSEDWGERFTEIGTRLGRAGFGKRGQEYLEAGIKYRDTMTEIEKRAYDQDKVRLENMSNAGQWVAQNIGENDNEFIRFKQLLRDPNNPVAKILGAEN